MRFEKDESVQSVVASTTDEIAQLKDTASALREQLDTVTGKYEQKIQNLERDARGEAEHLRDTIRVLRDGLEGKSGDSKAAKAKPAKRMSSRGRKK